MSDRARIPILPVPCSTPKGGGTPERQGGRETEQRNAGETVDLKSLAIVTLSRLRGGTIGGTTAERCDLRAFHPRWNEGASPDEVDASAGVAAFKVESRLLAMPVWFVADESVLADNSDITASGLPVFYFDEADCLRGMLREDLERLAAVKREFPRARVRR